MKAVVEHGGKLLRSVVAGKIGAAHVSHKKRVTCEHRLRPGHVAEVDHGDANAFQCVSGGLKKIESAFAKLDGVAIFYRRVRESGAGALAEIDSRADALGKLMMTGDKIGVKVGFNNVIEF